MSKFIVTFVLLSACVSPTNNPSPAPASRLPNQVPSEVTEEQIKEGIEALYGSRAKKGEDSWTCAEFLEELRSQKPKTVAETLQMVAQKRPKYLSHHTFAFESLSLQESSFEFPRAVVFGGDAKMVMTFNGKPEQKGYERLELMCFNDMSRTFEFREITFPADALSKDRLDDLEEDEHRLNFVVSPVGGGAKRACAQCHQTPSRPNWEPYPIWPGFYGAENDASTYQPSPTAELSEYAAWEKEHFDKFMAGSRKSGRYAYLTEREEVRPNNHFGHLLSELNAQRIVGELKALGPKFEKRKYHFLKAMMCSPRYEAQLIALTPGESFYSAIPKPEDRKRFHGIYRAIVNDYENLMSRMRSTTQGRKLEEDSESSRKQRNAFKAYLAKDPVFSNGVDLDWGAVSVMVNVKAVMDPLKVNIRNWSMELFGGYEHEDGNGGPNRSVFRQIMQRPFAKEFLSKDPELEKLLKENEKFAELNLYVPTFWSQETTENYKKICETIDRRIR